MNNNFGNMNNSQSNQNMNKINNNSNNSMSNTSNNITDSSSDSREPKETLPRKNETIIDGGVFSKNAAIKNISFDASSGLKVILKVSKETTYKDLMRKYVQKIGLSEDVINRDIIFLFNGGKMDPNSPEDIGKLPDFASITVIDQNNIIGA